MVEPEVGAGHALRPASEAGRCAWGGRAGSGRAGSAVQLVVEIHEPPLLEAGRAPLQWHPRPVR